MLIQWKGIFLATFACCVALFLLSMSTGKGYGSGSAGSTDEETPFVVSEREDRRTAANVPTRSTHVPSSSFITNGNRIINVEPSRKPALENTNTKQVGRTYLQLSEDTLRRIRSGHYDGRRILPSRSAKEEEEEGTNIGGQQCPKKYLFVNTHTYGRHHNQLQEFMNIIVWAKRTGRTAILGWFRYDHKWHEVSDFYSFKEVQKHYCVQYWHEVDALVAKDYTGEKLSALCLGQGYLDTPLKRLKARIQKCQMSNVVPAHYNTRKAMNTTHESFLPLVKASKEDLLVLSGQLAFFLRSGLEEIAAIFRLLRPTKEIQLEVEKTLMTNKFHPRWSWSSERREEGAVPPPSRRVVAELSGGAHDGVEIKAPFFAVHMRQREKECMKEVMESKEDGGRFLAGMGRKEWDAVSTQCALTVLYISTLMDDITTKMPGAGRGGDYNIAKSSGVGGTTSLQGGGSPPLRIFLASDGQNVAVEKELMRRGAVMYRGDLKGLKGLAVDFFVLSHGTYFTGNQLSSVTQNACFMRLGIGERCHGFIPAFSVFHARDVEKEVP